MLIDDLLARGVRYSPDAVAVQDAHGTLSFRELAQRVASLARGLVAMSATDGARVAVVAKNRADYVALYFACARVGAVLVPVNWRLAERELAWILADCEARVVVADAEFAPRIACEEAKRLLFDGERDGWRPLSALFGVSADLPDPADESTVAVQGGETIALGGLIQDQRRDEVIGVPLLADIPILGNLFKTTSDRIDRTELLVLLTPRVVRDLQDARDVTQELRERLTGLEGLIDPGPAGAE